MTLEIRLVPMFADNYGFLLHDPATGVTAVVDPGEPGPIIAELDRLGWKLDLILNTHHHPDHVGGNLVLQAHYGATVVGATHDAARIPGLDRAVDDGDTVAIGTTIAKILSIPGHTSSHIAYWFEDQAALFCGDTLFALGCGRLFEGTAPQMWASLRLLRDLPPETQVYCAHEYTQSNCNFALTVEPQNPALQLRAAEIAETRAAGRPTIPSTIALERATNPFLRADVSDLVDAAGLTGYSPEDAFAEIRRRKDNFR